VKDNARLCVREREREREREIGGRGGVLHAPYGPLFAVSRLLSAVALCTPRTCGWLYKWYVCFESKTRGKEREREEGDGFVDLLRECDEYFPKVSQRSYILPFSLPSPSPPPFPSSPHLFLPPPRQAKRCRGLQASLLL
jgi:hypothetical protein